MLSLPIFDLLVMWKLWPIPCEENLWYYLLLITLSDSSVLLTKISCCQQVSKLYSLYWAASNQLYSGKYFKRSECIILKSDKLISYKYHFTTLHIFDEASMYQLCFSLRLTFQVFELIQLSQITQNWQKRRFSDWNKVKVPFESRKRATERLAEFLQMAAWNTKLLTYLQGKPLQ